MMILLRFLLLALAVSCVISYKTLQLKIPNGARVPFPCKPGQIWQGVGHILDEGTGTRNPFGLDFASYGSTWTAEICKKDSDGDGRTNGEELGDPNCVWKENTEPSTTSGLSHPGICDPWDSEVCKSKRLTGTKYTTQADWLAEMCKKDGLDCPAINETGVRQMDLRVTAGTRIPAKETTYECQIFDLYALGLPRNQDFHLVAVTPIIDNRNVLHHITLSACADSTTVPPGPFECGMSASESCMELMHVWTVGLDGECYHPQCGVRIGQNGYKIVSIQLHWNNPTQRSDFTDSSGLRIYYNPNLRNYDAGVLTIGSIYFYLPPKRNQLTVQSTCSSSCTGKLWNGTVSVTSAWNHMHYAGNKMSIQVLRNNAHLTYLTNDDVYSYDSPVVQVYSDPIKLQPGDTLISKCGYSTLTRNKTTFIGEATQDEMCFGFITYYPKRNVTNSMCLDYMGLSLCDSATLAGCPHLEKFISEINRTDVFREVTSTCRFLSPCVDECLETILKFMGKDPCMSGTVWTFAQDQLALTSNGKEFLSRLSSCKTEVYSKLNTPQAFCHNSSASMFSAFISLVVLALGGATWAQM